MVVAILGWSKCFWCFLAVSPGCEAYVVGGLLGFGLLGFVGLVIAWVSRVILVYGTKWVDENLEDE
jgi:hypothetical protein